jgi:dihydroxy-acid dehydratase
MLKAIGFSDADLRKPIVGVTMGTEGMKTSLVSREAIADLIELVARGHMFDGLVALVGCDKTIPAAAMAIRFPSTSPRAGSTSRRRRKSSPGG